MFALARIASLICLVGAIGLSGCSRPAELIGVDNARAPALSFADTTPHKIFITTSRARSDKAGQFYSGARSSHLGLASVLLTVPPDHVSGAVERPRVLPPDPRTQFAVVEPEVYETDTAFIRAINAELAKRPAKDRSILFFVHGYNMTMSDAVLRVGQFVQDSGFTGVPVVFSWASAGRESHYVYDINSTLSARHMLDQASELLTRTNASGFDVFAHSMGGFLTMEVMVQSGLSGTLDSSGKLNNIMLAAPDIDIDVFRSQLAQIHHKVGNIYVLVSQDDFALRLSRQVSGGVVRVGAADAAELAKLGVTVIDLSRVRDSGSGTHSKFAGSPEVVQMIGQSLQSHNYDQPPRDPSVLEVLEGVPVLRDFIPG
ncbi:MAG: alpha/beta hydrolase [Pseudodonghicola sp.]|uniref:alpha/beta hydrolase n=1 Tax=Pseudodonghicola sp. TaxID=1969463 RepID=UPI003A9828C6